MMLATAVDRFLGVAFVVMLPAKHSPKQSLGLDLQRLRDGDELRDVYAPLA
jgi:hypothetical protein